MSVEARFIRPASPSGANTEVTGVNGLPGLKVTDDDVIIAVIALDIADYEIQTVRSISNPEKLAHLTSR